MHYKNIANLIDENLGIIFFSRYAYLVKKIINRKNRKEKYRVTR